MYMAIILIYGYYTDCEFNPDLMDCEFNPVLM